MILHYRYCHQFIRDIIDVLIGAISALQTRRERPAARVLESHIFATVADEGVDICFVNNHIWKPRAISSIVNAGSSFRT